MLTQVAGEPVCPSDDVDKAWRLHLGHRADYERLCRAILGAVPAVAIESSDEGRRATRLDYQRVFGVEAPAQVWPEADPPAAPPPDIRVSWRLPAPADAGPRISLALIAGSLALAASFHWLGLLDSLHRLDGLSMSFLVGGILVAIVVVLIGGVQPMPEADRRDTLDAYEAALLDGGGARVAATAIGMLVRLGTLQPCARPRHRWQLVVAHDGGARGASLHPVERACLAAAGTDVLAFEQAHAGVQRECDRMVRRLLAAGLMVERDSFTRRRIVALSMATALVVIACERLMHVFAEADGSQLLVMLTLLDCMIIFFVMRLAPEANGRGGRALLDLRSELAAHIGPDDQPPSRTLGIGLLPMTIALRGPEAVLAQPGFEGLADAIGPAGMRKANPSNDD